ncbi:hypothetical protein ABGB12_08640 [Actinocorallia sp. B10E7]|uniref:hypothetical protein n=1 Tax=Actinocorallia sp. B10E7 TaxID=3153558 RepID=UPI00325F7C8D
MPVNDLSDISGLDAKQRTVLAQKLEITSCYELIMADRQRVVDAFGKRAYRPTLKDVAVWQDEARRAHAASVGTSVPEVTSSGWEQTATFVVAFEERRQSENTERRIVAEQTEIEPEASPHQRAQWPGWTCDDVCRWMLERVGVPAAPPPLVPAQATSTETGGDAETPAETALSKIDIERVTLVDSRGDIELAADSHSIPETRHLWYQPARLLVTLSATRTGTTPSAVLQLVQIGGRKHIVPGTLDDAARTAEITLNGLPDGDYLPTIVIRVPDGSSLPNVLKLPPVELLSPSGSR